jgi:hypothetical protein
MHLLFAYGDGLGYGLHHNSLLSLCKARPAAVKVSRLSEDMRAVEAAQAQDIGAGLF